MSSTRLPGKVLTLLPFVVERLQHATRLDGIVVATSTEEADDPVATLAADLGAGVHRGPLDDVAGRVLAAAKASGLDAFVRVSADSPLLDQALVDEAVELFDVDVDLVTNVAPRSFPHGMSVEVVSVAALAGAHPRMTPEDREHVTPILYRGGFRIRSFTHEPDLSDVQLAVDTPDDLERLCGFVEAMTRPHWDYTLDDVLALAAAQPGGR